MSGSIAPRWPRLRVVCNGVVMAGVTDIEVLSNGFLAADRCWLSAAVGADPGGWKALADEPEILVDIAVCLDPGGGFVPLFHGEADSLTLDAVAGTLRLEGRDLSSRLIEARMHEAFSNRTASEIARDLAGRYGLAADVQGTVTPVGRYWQLQHDRLTFDQCGQATTAWDLLVTLARHEGFDLWVSGETLHFRQPDAQAAAIPLSVPDVTGIRLERSLGLARDVSVTVRSWNSRHQDAFAQTARRQGRGNWSARASDHVVVVPNLSSKDALNLAQARLTELCRHERVVSLEMPGELSIMPRARVALAGTGTGFDQSYMVDRVERRLSMGGGFMQRVRMRNEDEADPFATGMEGAGWIGS